MKTVMMNPKLDTEDISENALNYALYTQICHTNQEFGTHRSEDSEIYRSMLEAYPEKESAERELWGLGLGI